MQRLSFPHRLHVRRSQLLRCRLCTYSSPFITPRLSFPCRGRRGLGPGRSLTGLPSSRRSRKHFSPVSSPSGSQAAFPPPLPIHLLFLSPMLPCSSAGRVQLALLLGTCVLGSSSSLQGEFMCPKHALLHLSVPPPLPPFIAAELSKWCLPPLNDSFPFCQGLY